MKKGRSKVKVPIDKVSLTVEKKDGPGYVVWQRVYKDSEMLYEVEHLTVRDDLAPFATINCEFNLEALMEFEIL